MHASAKMELQKFFPTTGFDCLEDATGFDACVMQQIFTAAQCLLPFLNQSANSIGNILHTCQTHEEANAAFRQFQLASHACKSPCTQFRTDLQYSLPQFLRFRYMPYRKQDSQVFAFYLYLPSTVKTATATPSYGFISYIAEVAGWYNLFLGGSVLTLWQFLCACNILKKFKKDVKFNLLIQALTVLFLVVAGGVLIYILIDCITILLNNPIATSTELRTAQSGLSLSICWPQYTSIYDKNIFLFNDLAISGNYWTRGNNLSNKIEELSVRKSNGEWSMLWNRSMVSDVNQLPPNLFKIINLINSDTAVDFCHTVDLSSLPYQISQVLVRSVDDISLAIHLAGQLLNSQSYYEVANKDTMAGDKRFFLYGSEVSLQLEETSFQNVISSNCKQYNATWTYDNCLIEFALRKTGDKQDILRRLLIPDGTKVEAGVERKVLQGLYSILLSQNREKSCKPDCRSLAVGMLAEASAMKASPENGIDVIVEDSPQPLPPIDVKVNLTIPELIKFNKVRIYISYDHNC